MDLQTKKYKVKVKTQTQTSILHLRKDTARAYSDSELKVGEAFDGMRDKVFIAMKTAAKTPAGFFRPGRRKWPGSRPASTAVSAPGAVLMNWIRLSSFAKIWPTTDGSWQERSA